MSVYLDMKKGRCVNTNSISAIGVSCTQTMIMLIVRSPTLSPTCLLETLVLGCVHADMHTHFPESCTLCR